MIKILGKKHLITVCAAITVLDSSKQAWTHRHTGMQDSRQHTPSSSTSSAVDLTKTTSGLNPASPYPSSPNLTLTADTTATARRRYSSSRPRDDWNETIDAGLDPLRLDMYQDSSAVAGPSNTSKSSPYALDDDPFFSSPNSNVSSSTNGAGKMKGLFINTSSSYAELDNTRYGETEGSVDEHHVQHGSGSLTVPSTASLIEPYEYRDDEDLDRLRPASDTLSQDWSPGGRDVETRVGRSPKPKRRSSRYSSSSPLKKTGSALLEVSANLRRVSMRVVNTASMGLENQVKLEDEPTDSPVVAPAPADAPKPPPLRGRALGILGPDNKIRRAFFHVLQYPYVLCCACRLAAN